MLLREDAEAISKSKKDAYVKGQVLKLIPECFKKIREKANNIEFETFIWIDEGRFKSDVAYELGRILEDSGYNIKTGPGKQDNIIIRIYWRELNENEKKGDV
jgi:hypothetical protein